MSSKERNFRLSEIAFLSRFPTKEEFLNRAGLEKALLWESAYVLQIKKARNKT